MESWGPKRDNGGKKIFQYYFILSSGLFQGMAAAKNIVVRYFILEKKSKPVKMCFEDMMAQLEGAVGCERRLKAAQRHRQTRVATSRINQELAARLILT